MLEVPASRSMLAVVRACRLITDPVFYRYRNIKIDLYLMNLPMAENQWQWRTLLVVLLMAVATLVFPVMAQSEVATPSRDGL